MVMILCEIGDGAALWAAGRLQERGIRVDLVTGAALGAARRWEHRITGTDVRTAITLPDGLTNTTVTFAMPVLLASTIRPVILIVERRREAAVRNSSSDTSFAG